MSFSFMATVTICSDFGAPKIKSDTVSIVSPSICHEVMGPDGMQNYKEWQGEIKKKPSSVINAKK